MQRQIVDECPAATVDRDQRFAEQRQHVARRFGITGRTDTDNIRKARHILFIESDRSIETGIAIFAIIIVPPFCAESETDRRRPALEGTRVGNAEICRGQCSATDVGIGNPNAFPLRLAVGIRSAKRVDGVRCRLGQLGSKQRLRDAIAFGIGGLIAAVGKRALGIPLSDLAAQTAQDAVGLRIGRDVARTDIGRTPVGDQDVSSTCRNVGRIQAGKSIGAADRAERVIIIRCRDDQESKTTIERLCRAVRVSRRLVIERFGERFPSRSKFMLGNAVEIVSSNVRNELPTA